MPHDQAVIQVTTEDGHQFDLIDCGDPNSEHTLLFLPGLGISARHCIGFGQSLAAHGVRALIHEWRGAGSSSIRASRQVNWGYRTLLQYDLTAAIQSASTHANGPIWMGGHSLGSQLASMTASIHADQIKGLLIVAGGAPYWRAFHDAMRYKILLAAGFLSSTAMLTGYLPGKRIGFAGREARGVMVNWSRTIVSGRYIITGLELNNESIDMEAAMSRLDTQVLSLLMKQDHWVPQTSLEHLLNKMPQSENQLQVITNKQIGRTADHFGWMKSPEYAAVLIHDWMTTGAIS